MAIVDMLGKILVKNCNTPFTSMIEIFPHSFSFWSVTFWLIISLKYQQRINFPEIYFHWIEILNCFQSTGCFIIIAWAIAYVGFPTWITDRSMIFLTRCTGHESDLNEGRKGQTGPAAEESHCQVITCQHSIKDKKVVLQSRFFLAQTFPIRLRAFVWLRRFQPDRTGLFFSSPVRPDEPSGPDELFVLVLQSRFFWPRLIFSPRYNAFFLAGTISIRQIFSWPVWPDETSWLRFDPNESHSLIMYMPVLQLSVWARSLSGSKNMYIYAMAR